MKKLKKDGLNAFIWSHLIQQNISQQSVIRVDKMTRNDGSLFRWQEKDQPTNKGLLNSKSAKFGTFSLKDFLVDDRDENDNGLFRLSENISFFSDILKNSFDTSPNSAILSCL
jgi:hypothetical protein